MYQPLNPQTPNPRLPGLGHTEFRIPDTRTPKPKTAGSRVSGVWNSELGTIWGDQFNLIHNQTYRVPSSGHPNPRLPELGTRSEFQTPDTRDPAVLGFGVRVSGIRNSFRVPDTRYPRPGSLGFGVWGFRGWYISVWGLALKI
ncbi:hypothetical protein EV424DRAFT_1355716 [Suillus variegatus]|nr:hypothetical protein EV424DRAFT_1355716 [Suillus variegatus]